MIPQLDLKQQLALAIKLAAEKHLGQYDKAGEPYILHCLKVLHYLKSEKVEFKIAAVLHDIVEDTDITIEDLRAYGINDLSLSVIDLVTKKSGQSSEEYVKGISMSYGAVLVKLADLRHNSDIRRLKGLTDKDLQRLKKYNTMWVILTDAKRFHEGMFKFMKGIS